MSEQSAQKQHCNNNCATKTRRSEIKTGSQTQQLSFKNKRMETITAMADNIAKNWMKDAASQLTFPPNLLKFSIFYSGGVCRVCACMRLRRRVTPEWNEHIVEKTFFWQMDTLMEVFTLFTRRADTTAGGLTPSWIMQTQVQTSTKCLPTT